MNNRAYSVEITKFKFPYDLDDDKANFRLQVALRHKDHEGDKFYRSKTHTTTLD